MLQENKARQLFRKRTFLTPWYVRVCVCVSWGKKCSFFGKFGVHCFLVTLNLRFALLPYCRRLVFHCSLQNISKLRYLENFRGNRNKLIRINFKRTLGMVPFHSNTLNNNLNPFQPRVAFLIETSHLIYTANQMTGFYLEYDTGLKWIKLLQFN